MKIHPLVIAILMLMTLTDPSISSAQSNVQNQSADGAFTAEPGEKAKIALREEDLSFENYIDDAVRWGKQLRPAVPPIEGLKEAGFITNEEVFQLKKLPETLIVLGGGPIGLELGQSFARFGSKVTVVEMDRRLLAKEDEEVSATVEEIMRADGLRFC